MLDLLSALPDVPNTQRSLDLSHYLMSASPPTSDFSLLGYTPHHHNHFGNAANFISLNSPNVNPSTQQLSSSDTSFNNTYNFSNNANNLNDQRYAPLKSIIIKTESEVVSDSESDHGSSDTSCSQSPGRHMKRVTFADHRGLALTHVRILKESPDDPPRLSSNILSSLTLGASADVVSKPPITLCFAQPASDYLLFRDKLLNNLVCLENVILRDYTVEGTIKVKNITFEKRVFVRLSLDEWETSEDHEATYVPGPGFCGADTFDTFSFKVDISPSFDVKKKIQFAVCYCESDNEHWDNNGSHNYCIVSENTEPFEVFDRHEDSVDFNDRWLPIKKSNSWTEFSVWRDLHTNCPYY